MRITNYFRCGDEPFFFKDGDEESTRRAFNAMVEYLVSLGDVEMSEFRYAVYKTPLCRGPWDKRCQVIGESPIRGTAVN